MPVADTVKRFTAIQLDLTDDSDEHRDILQKYGLFGPPSVLFFNADGEELAKMRLQGEIRVNSFLTHIKSIANGESI